MSRKRKKRRTEAECVYCGDVAACTDEHVVPQCLFPEGHVPPKADFVIVPVCGPCNNRKAGDDSYVRDIFVCDINAANNPVVKAVLETVYRSQRKGWSQLGRTVVSKGSLKAVHTPSGLYLGHNPTVPVDVKRLRRFLRLVTRGLYWKAFGARIPNDYEFKVNRLSTSAFLDKAREFLGLTSKPLFGIGKGVFNCTFLIHCENPFATIWLMAFYESVYFMVTTGPVGFIPKEATTGNRPTAIGPWGLPMKPDDKGGLTMMP